MGAIAPHNTAVVEGEWDGTGAVASMPAEAAVLRYCHTWVDPDGDPDAKSSYKFPHHRESGGPANLPAVRNALARLPQANIPEGDRAGVERHLRRHLDAQESDSLRELRSYAAEMRAEGEGEAARIVGMAAVYNAPSEVLSVFGEFVEVIEPGFFEGVMEDDVRALWNHNADLVLGRTRSGTLELRGEETGLGITVHPPDTQAGRDALTSIGRGDVDQMSFAFSVKMNGDQWTKRPDGVIVRTLKRGGCARLYDVSPVTFPAYPQTSVQVRAMVESLNGRPEGGDPGQAPGQEITEAERVKAHHRARRRRLEIEELK